MKFMILIHIMIGIFAGLCSSAFLFSLELVTDLRTQNKFFIWGLPVLGFSFGLILKKIPHHLNQGIPHLLQEIDDYERPVSPWMTPFIFISSLATHLFGGSVGREGVGVIMGISMAHLVPKFKLSYQQIKPHLIYSGAAAGLSSIFGTPIAAIIFSFEFLHFKDIKRFDLILTSTLSSIVAYYLSHQLGPAHQVFNVNFEFNSQTALYILIASISSGLGGHLFFWGLKFYTRLISKFIPEVHWKLFFGGFFITALVYLSNGYDYIGIGTDFINHSFSTQMGPYDFFMKCLLTIMTISIGLKGGEVTPLFFMGATLSNSLAGFIQLNNFAMSSALGMVSLFGAVTATPLASGIMGMELFGPKVGLGCIICCYLARFLMAQKTVYRH